LAKILKFLHFTEALVRKKYQVIVFAPNKEKLWPCHKYLKNVKIQVAELKIPVFSGTKLLVLGSNSLFDLSDN
jgi:hypothetical protein